MARPTHTLIILFAVFAIGSLLALIEGKPQQRLQNSHITKRESSAVEDYQGDYYGNDYPDSGKADYTSDGYNEEEVEVDPTIISKGDTFMVDKGTTIRLPCYVDKFPENSYIIMWKKVKGTSDPNSFLVVDKNIMDKHQKHRMSVEVKHDEDIHSHISEGVAHRGSTLVIGLANEEDEGQYICQIAGHDDREIKHTVNIRAPPTITKSPSNGLLKVDKGDSVTMSCYGQGKPKPKISWRRLGKKMPDGRMEIEAEELSFKSVTRQHSGTYECVADNGFGQPARQTIHVDVDYLPEVEAEEIFVHASTGNNVELVCNVHAHPKPTVKWFKNTMELTDETAQLEQHGHRYTLNLPTVDESDLGNYTCRAQNQLGKAERILEVSGKAGFAKFTSKQKGTEPTTFLLEWKSESSTPITAFELRWREHGDGSWHSEEITPIRLNNYEWAGKHSIRDLKAASRFEATVAAMNSEDWSRHSPTYHFSTFGAEPLTDPNSSTSIQPFLSTIISTRSHILLSVVIALITATWRNQL